MQHIVEPPEKIWLNIISVEGKIQHFHTVHEASRVYGYNQYPDCAVSRT